MSSAARSPAAASMARDGGDRCSVRRRTGGHAFEFASAIEAAAGDRAAEDIRVAYGVAPLIKAVEAGCGIEADDPRPCREQREISEARGEIAEIVGVGIVHPGEDAARAAEFAAAEFGCEGSDHLPCACDRREQPVPASGAGQ